MAFFARFRRLRRVLQEFTDPRHPRLGHLLEVLHVLRELLEGAGVELRIPQGLSDQFRTALGQPSQPAAVLFLGGRLLTDRLATLHPVELLGRQLSQFLVPRQQFHLAITNLRGLLLPAGDLVVDPEGVIGGGHHEKDRRRRIDPAPARQIVLGKRPHLHRLRRDRQCRR